MDEVLKYLRDAEVFYLATCEGDKPRVRPFGAVCQFENKIYITTANKKDVFKQLIKNSKVEISAMNKDGTWIRIEAIAIHDNRKEARLQMLKENPVLSQMYSADDNIMEVLYLQNVVATIYSFTKEPIVIKF